MKRPRTPSELLDALAEHGFARDPALRMRAEYVAAELGAGRKLEELKTLLAPLLASSEEAQAEFYDHFDAVLRGEDPAGPGTSGGGRGGGAPAAAPKSPPRAWPMLAATAALTFAVAAVAATVAGRSGDVVAVPTPSDTTKPFIDSAATAPASQSDSAVRPLPVTPEGGGDLAGAPPPSQASMQLPVLFPKVEADEPPGGMRLWEMLRYFLALLPVALVAAYLLWRRLFLHPGVMRGPEAVSPFALRSPRPPRPGFPYDPEELRRASRAAARRQRSDTVRLSVRDTVSATVASGGYPAFRYRAQTRPSEYLFLIERKSPRDQQAWLFAELADRLAAEGVHVHRYFFDGDPRVSFPEDGGRGVRLADLFRDHAEHRLFVCGDGRSLADPVTGRLLPWTVALTHWAERAVLTPEPVGRWGMREGFLAEELPVFPATLDGVREAVEFFAQETDQDWYHWWERHLEGPAPAPPPATAPVGALRGYLGERGFHWLSALSVYPEVHWRLTLLLGTLAEPEAASGEEVERDLARLVRLPWLRRGSIPDHDREALLEALGETEETAVREKIRDVLEQLAREPGAARSARMHYDHTVQRLFLHRGPPPERRKLLREVRRLPRAPLLQDVAVVRLLERTTSPLVLRLPERFRRFLFPAGFPHLGLRAAPAALGAGVLAALLWLAPFWPKPELTLPILSMELAPDGFFVLPARPGWSGVDGDSLHWSTDDPATATLHGDTLVPRAPYQTTTLVASGRRGQARIPLRIDYWLPPPGPATEWSPPGVVVMVRPRTLAARSARLAPVLADTAAVRWTSCTPGAASVSADGVILGHAPGEAIVAARSGNLVEFGRVRIDTSAVWRVSSLVPRSARRLSGIDERRVALRTPIPVSGSADAAARAALDQKRRLLEEEPAVQVLTRLVGGDARERDAIVAAVSEVAPLAPDLPSDRTCEVVSAFLSKEAAEPGIIDFEVTDATIVTGDPLPQETTLPPPPTDTTGISGTDGTVPGTGAVIDQGQIFQSGGTGGQPQGGTPPDSPVVVPPPVTPPAGSPVVVSPQNAREVGDAAFRAGDLSRAAAAYRQIQTRDPRTVPSLYAVALSRQGRWAEADTLLQEVLRGGSSDRVALNEHCVLLAFFSPPRSDLRCQDQSGGDLLVRTALTRLLRGIEGLDSVAVQKRSEVLYGPEPAIGFEILSRFEPAGNGRRRWTRGPRTWTETSTDSMRSAYMYSGRARVGGDEGAVFRRTDGGSFFEVFVPDRSYAPRDPPARYRTRPEDPAWRYLGPVLGRDTPPPAPRP